MEAQERYQAKLHLVAEMQARKSWATAAQDALLPVSRASAYRLARWAKEAGKGRLQEGRHGHPSKLCGAMREWLEQQYGQPPDATGRAVQVLIQEHFGVTLSITHLNRFRATLRKAGRLGEKEQTELHESAGSLLLLAAAQETGLISALEGAISTEAAPERFAHAPGGNVR